MAGQGMVERAAEAVHVGEESLALAFDFFRRDVIGRAFGDGGGFRLGFGAAGQAEIHQLRFVIGVEENIARLDVAMEQVVFKRHVERGGDLDADVEALRVR